MQFSVNKTLLYEASLAQRKPRIFFQILIFFAVFLLASIAMGSVVGISTVIYIFANGVESFDPASLAALAESPMVMLVSLLLTGFETLFAILFCRQIERRSLASMGFVRKGALSEYAKGFLFGLLLFALALGIALLLGTVTLTAAVQASAGLIALFLLGYLIQGMAEEVMVRGYLMLSLANRTSLAWAVGISSFVFAALHLPNPGISLLAFVNLTLFGVLAALYVLRSGSLFGACALHSAWNFAQGNLFGISVSGNALQPAFLETTLKETGTLWNGGAFGLEGGLCVTIVLLAAIALILFLPKKQTVPDAAANNEI